MKDLTITQFGPARCGGLRLLRVDDIFFGRYICGLHGDNLQLSWFLGNAEKFWGNKLYNIYRNIFVPISTGGTKSHIVTFIPKNVSGEAVSES